MNDRVSRSSDLAAVVGDASNMIITSFVPYIGSISEKNYRRALAIVWSGLRLKWGGLSL